MSEYDKGRDGRKKKFYANSKDSVPRSRAFFPSKDAGGASGGASAAEKPPPVILLKAREPPTAPATPSTPLGAENQPEVEQEQAHATQPTKIAQNERKTNDVKSLSPLVRMPRPCKLIDDSQEFLPSAAEHLQDSNTNFLVVGVVGLQGVGKSTILSILAHSSDMSSIADSILSSHEQEAEDKAVLQSIENNMQMMSMEGASRNIGRAKAAEKLVFKCQTMEQIEGGLPCTSGVDMYVTESRVILLDAGACGGSGLSRGGGGGGGSGLEVAALLQAVCHVVILVQDWFCDINMLRFIQSAEIVKPSLHPAPGPTAGAGTGERPASEGGDPAGLTEHQPHLLFLHNKCNSRDFTPQAVRHMQQLYRKAFHKSKLQIESGMFMYTASDSASVFHNLTPQRCGPPLNLFLMPNIVPGQDKSDVYCGHPSIEELSSRLRWQVFGAPRGSLSASPTPLTERGWLHHCARQWDNIRKSTFFMEYSRLLP